MSSASKSHPSQQVEQFGRTVIARESCQIDEIGLGN